MSHRATERDVIAALCVSLLPCACIVGGRAFLLERARAQRGRDRVALARELGHLRAVAGRRAAPLVLERRARVADAPLLFLKTPNLEPPSAFLLARPRGALAARVEAAEVLVAVAVEGAWHASRGYAL